MPSRYNKSDGSISIEKVNARLRSSSSSCVARLEYDESTEELIVQFQQRGTYKYYGVPADVAEEFQNAGLMGSYFNLYIRPFYDYERIA